MTREFPKYIGVRLTRDGREALRALVQREQTSTSEYVRKLIEQEAQRDVQKGATDGGLPPAA